MFVDKNYKDNIIIFRTIMEKSTSCSTREKDESSEELCDEFLSETKSEFREEILSNESSKKDFISQNKLKFAPYLNVYGKELKPRITIDDEFIEKARKELRETPEVVAEALKTIRELVKGDSDLFIPDHDEFFTIFLRPCKWYPTSAFHMMQRYYKFRLNYPYMMQNLTPMNMKYCFCADLLVPLPIECIDGSRLLLMYGGAKWKPKEYSPYDLLKCLMIMLELVIKEPATQIAGIQIIIDAKNLPLSHVAYITPKFAGIMTEWIQRCVPCRLKNIHIINQPFIANVIFTIFKPFLSEKFYKRIFFHGTNREKLINMIGRKALPKEYGGLELSESPIGEDVWNYFCHWQKEYEDSLKYGYINKK
ncbi:alpha-tocopherol transfer protein-like isoform X1 [Vespa mandarinia]|uniref:alpha-tocopherol transfer protein-like isoform X1 n=2 Tax=Vespa mandarinia TaxID=7446 RepID=UPI001614B225|nr:alpha-tocopherol transfer protein-like isoform X1 [Vespa mandarinia]